MWPPSRSRTVSDLRTSLTSACLKVRLRVASSSMLPSRSKWPTPCLYRTMRVRGRVLIADTAWCCVPGARLHRLSYSGRTGNDAPNGTVQEGMGHGLHPRIRTEKERREG